MQTAALYRRGIVLPLDQDAEDALRSGDSGEAANVRLLMIPGAEVFESLWHLGLIRNINEMCATLMDDYEEEMIEPSSVGGVIAAVDSVARDAVAQHPEVISFLSELRDLARQAAAMSRPLLFVL